jgi:hypothetical protein
MNKEKEKIKLLKEIESITQMQYDCLDYLEAGCSYYPYNGNCKNTMQFFTGNFTNFDKFDEDFGMDLNGYDLDDVAYFLFSKGMLNMKDIKILS